MKQQHKPKKQLLLLEDVDGLGYSGDIVTARPGFVRNFLLPFKKAVLATKATLLMQTKLKEERQKRAVIDKKEAEELAQKIEQIAFVTVVKVDPEGKMYGSVTSFDVASLLLDKGFEIKRQNVLMLHPIKTLGKHVVSLKLKEGVVAKVNLTVEGEGMVLPQAENETPKL